MPAGDPVAALSEAAGNRLPPDPDYVLGLVAEAGGATPLPTLHRLVGAIREREQAETRPGRRRDWLTVRGAVHQALAARGSRVAAYDLRESIETADGPLPDDFVQAARVIGDATVLEALVGAFDPGAGRRRRRLARDARRRRPRDHLARAAHETTRCRQTAARPAWRRGRRAASPVTRFLRLPREQFVVLSCQFSVFSSASLF